jgi:hypothetical protein
MGFLTGRLMRTLRPGVAATLGLGSEYRRYWEESNERARQADGPLWVAVGDSTAQGIGASAPDRGYVGQLLVRLRDEQRRPWRVVNLSVTGARVADVVREQVPRINEVGEPELVTCAAGANDVIRVGFRRVVEGASGPDPSVTAAGSAGDYPARIDAEPDARSEPDHPCRGTGRRAPYRRRVGTHWTTVAREVRSRRLPSQRHWLRRMVRGVRRGDRPRRLVAS